MLKKIKVSDARLGMYLHSICGNWMEHPFWKKSFKLCKEDDLHTLLNCGVEELLIDTSKGLDVEVIEANNAEIKAPEVEKLPKTLKKKQEKVSLQNELIAAKQIHSRSKEAVISMFSEVRMGNAIEDRKSVV